MVGGRRCSSRARQSRASGSGAAREAETPRRINTGSAWHIRIIMACGFITFYALLDVAPFVDRLTMMMATQVAVGLPLRKASCVNGLVLDFDHLRSTINMEDQMSLIPAFYLDAVVALGDLSQDGSANYHSTGFLYGWPAGENEQGQKLHRTFLVTNKHVLTKARERQSSLQARFNTDDGSSANVYPINTSDEHWNVNQEHDVAVLSLNPAALDAGHIQYFAFHADLHTFTLEQAQSEGISEGDGVFVLGFPLGLVGEERNYVIARQGVIARVQDWLKGSGRDLLIDASIFPGNSGGPVLLKPEVAAISGTKAHNSCVLIGMVSSYLPYREVAVSQQTGRPRMIFEENSGLGRVVPNDVIQETIKTAVQAPEQQHS